MKTTECYIRYSDHNQDDGYSVEYQTTEIAEFCLRHNLVLHKTHIDQAQTATKVAGRESFFALIDRVKQGIVGTIIVYKMNRMFRNALESHNFRKLFRKHGVKIMSVTEMIDEDSSAGRLMTNVIADIDQYNSENTSDHVKSSMREMARQGHYTGGPVLYGFGLKVIENGTKIRKTFVPVESEVAIIREIFSLYADNHSLPYIQDYLRDNGMKTRNGKDFAMSALWRILKKETYIGTHRFKTQGYDELVIEDCFDPIIDKELWNKVRERMARHKTVSPRRAKQSKRIYSLTGLIVCSECGSPYTGYASGKSRNRPNEKTRYYYACSKKRNMRDCQSKTIRKDDTEKAVLKAVKENILNESSIKELSEQVTALCKENPKEIVRKISSLKATETRLMNRLGELIEMKLEGTYSSEILQNKREETEAELQAVKIEMLALSEQQKNTITEESVAEYLHKMLDNLDESNDEIVRYIFEAFVEKVTIGDDNVNIFLKVHPSQFVAYSDTNGPPFVAINATHETK